MDAAKDFPKQIPPQKQGKQPGLEKLMNPRPVFEDPNYKASNRLQGKVAVITGGDSGIGRAVAVAYAMEGADIAVLYLDEHEDAEETKKVIEGKGRKCIAIAGDIGEESFCFNAVKKIIDIFGKIDVLVNNAAEQHAQNSVEDITKDQLERTFKTNIFSMFYMTKACLPHMKEGTVIINTSSITAYKGHERLIDYSSTKGAITTFTRSLAISLSKRNIRVNAVAPGPIWTPLIPASFTEEEVSKFGSTTNLGRPGQPVELAPAYVFLASDASTFITGETMHVNGGEIVNG
ncbi:SDR family oxidoreductase [Clostridium swellfunianum]|uniref:SDR family oxidoreductase n=1 Tax=Clostridium swellfunianum TaxID=1367462 RepID=UPI00202FB5DD|nr:SDR family oxidoreductase [Clostridium swellfunianum]MCM0648342.1 SDR family oxidoreductase [Clostridium swellfunianum]